jgi:hypothetical protein
MSLLQGMPISSIVEHLGVRFVITLQPQQGKFYLERLLEVGKEVAEQVLRDDVLGEDDGVPVKGWRDTFLEGYNTDHTPVGCFVRSDIARVEQKVIAIAAERRDKFLSDPGVQELPEEIPELEGNANEGLIVTSAEPDEPGSSEAL